MISIGQAYKDFWKNYVKFRGETTRAGYWWVQLVNGLIMAILTILVLVSALSESVGLIIFFGSLMVIYGLIVLIPNLSIECRRLQDLGISFEISLVLCLIDLPLAFMGLVSVSSIFSLVMLVFYTLPTGKFKK